MVVYNTPWENPYTKAAFGLGIAWVAFMAVKHAKGNDLTPERRKHRQALTMNSIDLQIDSRNRATGKKLPSNPNIPFFSRHNYNRRRRSKNV